MKGRRSTPGRYFQVAEPGTGWGGTKISDPLSVLGPFDPKVARPGMTMLMVSTTGEHAAYYELDAALRPVEKPMPADLKFSVERIQENCEPALCTVLFMGGAGGSLRAGVTDNPVRLTRSVKDALTRVTSGGAPVYVWPGRRHHLHGRRHAVAGRRVRLRADAGAGRADRVHAAAIGLCGARRPYGSCSPAGVVEGERRNPPDGAAAIGIARHEEAAANRMACGRQAASSAGWPDRPDRGGARQRGKFARGLWRRGSPLHRPAR